MKYRMHSGSLHHRDEWVFRLTRYHDDGRMEVLTNDGWQEFSDGMEIGNLPSMEIGNLPSISGIDLVNMEKVVNLIADMEDRIKQAINEKEAEDNAPSQTPEQQHEQIEADIEAVSGISEIARGPADEDYFTPHPDAYKYRQEYPSGSDTTE